MLAWCPPSQVDHGRCRLGVWIASSSTGAGVGQTGWEKRIMTALANTQSLDSHSASVEAVRSCDPCLPASSRGRRVRIRFTHTITEWRRDCLGYRGHGRRLLGMSRGAGRCSRPVHTRPRGFDIVGCEDVRAGQPGHGGFGDRPAARGDGHPRQRPRQEPHTTPWRQTRPAPVEVTGGPRRRRTSPPCQHERRSGTHHRARLGPRRCATVDQGGATRTNRSHVSPTEHHNPGPPYCLVQPGQAEACRPHGDIPLDGPHTCSYGAHPGTDERPRRRADRASATGTARRTVTNGHLRGDHDCVVRRPAIDVR